MLFFLKTIALLRLEFDPPAPWLQLIMPFTRHQIEVQVAALTPAGMIYCGEARDLGAPFTLAASLQSRAVDDYQDQSLGPAIHMSPNRHAGVATRQRGMIRARRRQAHQLQHRAQEAFRLAQRQVKEQTRYLRYDLPYRPP